MRASSDGADRHVLLQTEVQLGRGAHNVRFSLLLFMGGLCRREHSSDSDRALVLSRDAPPLSNRGEGRVLL
jgi:hypothetical protein